MKYEMGSTIMLWKTVIWYLSTQRFLGPGRPDGQWPCLYNCYRKPLSILYLPSIIILSALRTSAILTTSTAEMFPH